MSPADLCVRLDRYLALRRALGFAMRVEERLLRDFLLYVETRRVDGPHQAHAAVEWACSGAERRGPGHRARRLTVVRGFLVHLRAHAPETTVPGPGLLGRAMRPTARLFSQVELDALMSAARRLGPPGSLRPHTYETLIGLLSCTGLRAGEAVRLRVADVRLDDSPPCLVVLRTKFRKSRLVPLHPSAAIALRAYAGHKMRLGYEGRCDSFFVSERRAPIAHGTLRETILSMARQAGVRTSTSEKGPSLHSLRHGFAVARLLAWYREGADVAARVPELSVYLGHVRPDCTYWYLSATPELLRIASDRFEAVGGEEKS